MVPLFRFLLDYYGENESSRNTVTRRAMKMKNKHRRKTHKKAYDRALMDEYGQEYQIVEKRLPGQHKSVYDTFVIKRKRTDFWVDIMVQLLVG